MGIHQLSLMRNRGLLISCLLSCVFCAACGGVSRKSDDLPLHSEGGSLPEAAPHRTVRIEPVVNSTGRAECADLCHYAHLKAAQVLEAHGWAVLSDDLLSASDFLDLKHFAVSSTVADCSLRIEIVRAEEKAGATLSVVVFSSQKQHANATLRLRWRDLRTGAEHMHESRGNNSKGAWGVLAKVNRETLVRREGFWQFDQSLLGGAVADALNRDSIFSFPQSRGKSETTNTEKTNPR